MCFDVIDATAGSVDHFAGTATAQRSAYGSSTTNWHIALDSKIRHIPYVLHCRCEGLLHQS